MSRPPPRPGAGKPPAAGVSLPRALSKLGLCSRSEGDALVKAGRVRVDGAIVRDPTVRVDMGRVTIRVDDAAVGAEPRVYLMLHKPAGVVTTRDDPDGRDTVYRFLDPALPFVAPVGRLDLESEGLLLFTNHTHWAQRLLDPESQVPKTYHVAIDRAVDDALLERLRAGVTDRRELLRVVSARALAAQGDGGGWLEIVLDHGRNRHIRRMLGALGVGVRRLVRVAIGPLALGDVPQGATRALDAAEIAALDFTGRGGPDR